MFAWPNETLDSLAEATSLETIGSERIQKKRYEIAGRLVVESYPVDGVTDLALIDPIGMNISVTPPGDLEQAKEIISDLSFE